LANLLFFLRQSRGTILSSTVRHISAFTAIYSLGEFCCAADGVVLITRVGSAAERFRTMSGRRVLRKSSSKESIHD
jgi:hypothetical protein